MLILKKESSQPHSLPVTSSPLVLSSNKNSKLWRIGLKPELMVDDDPTQVSSVEDVAVMILRVERKDNLVFFLQIMWI